MTDVKKPPDLREAAQKVVELIDIQPGTSATHRPQKQALVDLDRALKEVPKLCVQAIASALIPSAHAHQQAVQ